MKLAHYCCKSAVTIVGSCDVKLIEAPSQWFITHGSLRFSTQSARQGRATILLLAYIVNGLALSANGATMDVKYGQNKTSITLTCHVGFATSIRWKLNSEIIVKSKERFWSGKLYLQYEPKAGVLKNRAKIIKFYKIKIPFLPEINGTYWQCCGFHAIIPGFCSDNHQVNNNIDSPSTSARNSSYVSSPEQDVFLNGTIHLRKVQDDPFQVTLTCTIDEEIDEDKWSVIWYRDASLIWLTNGTSAITVGDDPSNNGSTSTEVQDDVRVTWSPRQYNVTFNISEETAGTWNCFNAFLRDDNKRSNNITVDAQDLSSSVDSSTSGTKDTSPTPPDATSATTPVSDATSSRTEGSDATSSRTEGSDATSSRTEGSDATSSITLDTDATSSRTEEAGSKIAFQATHLPDVLPSSSDEKLPVIAGTLCGVISLLLLIVILVLVLRRNRKSKKPKEKETDNGGLQKNTREEVVMEDNVLYEDSKFDYSSCSQNEETVMEDNDLYEGGTMKDQDPAKNEIVMEDNVVYEGGQFNGGLDKEEIEMQVNAVYSSSP